MGTSMSGEGKTMQALQEKVSKLELRVKELGEENQDLREICNENGVRFEQRATGRAASQAEFCSLTHDTSNRKND